MKHFRLIIFIGAFITSSHLWAQGVLVPMLPDTAANSGDTLRVDIKIQNFVEIVSFQFSLRYDPQVIQFVSSEPADLQGVAVGMSASMPGVLRFSWFNVQGVGLTLPDGAALVRLKFFVNGNDGDFTDLLFSNSPLRIEFQRPNAMGTADLVPNTPKNGSVAVGLQNTFQSSFNVTNVLCNGANTGAISTTLINKPDDATINWTGPNNFQSQAEDLSRLTAGNYNLQIINGETVLLDTIFNITQPITPLNIDSVAVISASCDEPNGTATVLAAGGVAPYRYSLGSNFVNRNQFSNLAPGFYNLTVRDSNNCIVTDTFRIQTAEAPQINLPATLSLCPGQTTTLDAGAHTTYFWSTGATSRSITIDTIGIYSVTVSDGAACSASDSVQVLPGSAPPLALADSVTVCPGQNTTLDAGNYSTYLWSTGATTRTIEVGTGTYQITATDANGCTASDAVRVAAGSNLSVQLADSVAVCQGQSTILDAGSFATYRWSTGATTRTVEIATIGTYRVTVTNGEGCSGSDSIRVVTAAAPTVQLADSLALCEGQSRVLDAGDFASYRWSTGAVSRVIGVASPGTYTVTVSNAVGCTAADSIRVVTAPLPEVELGDTAFICNGENVMLDAGMHLTYRWSTGATTPTITVSNAGSFSVTVMNAAACTATDTILIIIDNNFEARIENDTLSICPGTPLQLRASVADSYQWIDTSKTLSALNIRNPVARPTRTTGYTLIAGSTCGTDTVQVEIQVLEVTATAGPDTCIGPGDELELYATGGVAYFWFLSEYPVSNPNIPNPTTQPEDSTSYFVMITDANGCQKFDTIVVLVANNPLDVNAVNMITPNGDGKNDVLEFSSLEKYGLNTLKVFNRWGDQVYQKINYQKDEERFDGTRNGKLLPAGNYYYILSFQSGDVKQTLTIVRE